MKKRLCILLLSLAMCAMFVCVAAAADYTKRTSVDSDSNYALPLTGSYSVFTAEGGNKYCFSTIRNTSTTAIYATVSVRGEEIDGDYRSQLLTNTNTYLTTNIVVATEGLIRLKGDAGIGVEYTHRGKTCDYRSTNSVYDDFRYIVEQE